MDATGADERTGATEQAAVCTAREVRARLAPEESRSVRVCRRPSSPITSTTWWLAARVTAPRTAHSWRTSVSAVDNNFSAAEHSGTEPMAALARASARRLARQSIAVTQRPSERRALPMTVVAPCAGIQVSMRCEVNTDTSASRIVPIRDQTCANGLLGPVTLADPLAAADSIDKQSVKIGGGSKVIARTNINAQSSLAAAVRTDAGGTALPKAIKSPFADTTTMAQPVRRNSQICGNFIEPSVYHLRSLRVTSGGSVYHFTASSSCGGGRGMVTANNPRVRKRSCLA